MVEGAGRMDPDLNIPTRARAVKLDAERIIERKREQLMTRAVMAFRSGQLEPLHAYGVISELAALEDVLSMMDSEIARREYEVTKSLREVSNG